MAKSDRGRHPPASMLEDIHPPHQRGKRLSREELRQAIKDAPRSKGSADKIVDENQYATDKARYFAEHPEVPGATERARSAIDTVVLTTNYIRPALHRRVEIATQNQQNASQTRDDVLRRELRKLLLKYPKESAKQIIRLLQDRTGDRSSGIEKIADDGVHWVDWAGNRRVTSHSACAGRLSRLRGR